MSLDLGDLRDVATAIGLVNAQGDPVPGWFSRPETHLARVLSDPVQRAALIRLADELLAGPEGATDDSGRSWLPVVEVDGGALRLFLTLQEGDGGAAVRLGIGARLQVTSGGVDCELDAHVPLFVAGTAVTDPVLIGRPGAHAEVALRLRLPAGTTTGQVELAAAELAARIPTAPGEQPTVRLALQGLRMPGASQPRDLVVDADDVSELDDALLELVLGLVQAQVDALPAGEPLRGLATLLGLADDDVPDFPVADVAARGPLALADWLASAVTGNAKQDWVGGLAALLGGAVTGAGTPDAAVEVTVAGAPVRLELLTTPGPSGRPVVVPRLSVGVSGGPGTRLALAADLVSLDLGGGEVLALPRLSLTGRLDPPGSTPLLPPVAGPGGLQVSVGALEVGVALDTARRPVLVVRAEDADVGATHYDVLDLSTPDALAAVAAGAVGDAAQALLAGIGSAGGAVSVLLGLTAPPAAPGAPLLDAADLLRDPVGAVRRRWLALLAGAPADVRAVLESAQDAVADERVRAQAVTGDGTAGSPWVVPLAPAVDLRLAADDGTLRVGIAAAASLADLGGTGVTVGLDLQVDVLEAELAAGSARFLPGVRVRLVLHGPAGAPLQLEAGGIAVSTRAVGAETSWTPEAGTRLVPVLSDARLRLPGGDVLLPDLRLDAERRLDLDADGWRAVELAVGAVAEDLARRVGAPWLSQAAALLGWASQFATAGTSLAGGAARLDLALLVRDPDAALADFSRAVAVDEGALRALLEVLAEGLVRGAVGGRASTSRPWTLPLVTTTGPLLGLAADAAPALTLSLGAAGAAAPPSFVEPALRNWLPGEDGLDVPALLAALARDSEIDDVLADLLAGRADLDLGFTDLLDRWAGTDGLVTLPDDALPVGVTGHRPSELPHGAPLDGPEMREVLADLYGEHLGGEPATVVLVAVSGEERHGAPEVLAGPDVAALPPERVLDLTAGGLPPEAFVAPSATLPQQPLWVVRLGTRAACRLPAGHPDGPDGDGVSGQVARLRRVLAPLAGTGRDVVLVAHGGAGHAALRAVSGLPGVRALVTIGTPYSPVSLDTLDAAEAGEALRLAAALLRVADDAVADPEDAATDPDEGDDPDLALARALVAALLDRDPYPDPLADLRPPTALAAPAGVPVHAVVGSCSAPALRRALTATVSAALSALARARDRATTDGAGALRLGVAVPFEVPPGPGGITARARVALDLLGMDPGSTGVSVTGPALVVRLAIGAASGWLVGGPDPGRGSGGARPLACRRVTAEVRVPLVSWGSPSTGPHPARARLVLHDVLAFGVRRDRWVVEPGAGGSGTALLPEVRAVLGEVTARVASAAGGDPAVAALRDALAALGVLGPDGGTDSITLERLLIDPRATVTAAVADALRVQRLAAALRVIARDGRAEAGATVRVAFGDSGEVVAVLDLATASVSVTAASPGAGSARLPWQLSLAAAGDGTSVEVRVGPDLQADGAAGVAVTAEASSLGLAVRLHRRPPGAAVRSTALWPAPEVGDVLDAITAGVPGLVLGAVLDAARTSLAGLSPPAAAAVDALLEAAGLLADATTTGSRHLRPVAAVVDEPVAWLRSRAGALTTAVPRLLDAVRALLGAAGDQGTLPLADGVSLRATATGGRLVTALDVDASAFTPPAGGLGLVLSGSAGLSLAATPGDAVLPDLQLEIAVAGSGALRLRVGPDAGGPGNGVGVTLAVAPPGRPEVVLLPGGPGLAGLTDAAAAGAVAALPVLLNALAENDPPGDPSAPEELAGRFVTRVGDALALRAGTPARFDGAALTAFGADPAAALAARGAALAATGLTLLSEAVAPLLGPAATRSVATDAGALVVTVGALTIRWRPGTARVEADLTLTGVPGVERVDVALAVDSAGLALLDLSVGPAPLDAGVVTLAPFARVRAGAAPAGGRAVEIGLALAAGTTDEQRLVARWDLSAREAGLLAVHVGPGPTDLTELTDPATVSLVALGAVLDLAGGVVLALPAVQSGLTEPVLGTTVAELLEGVLLAPGVTDRLDPALSTDLGDGMGLLRRLGLLAANLAAAPDAALPIDDRLVLRVTSRPDSGAAVLGVNLAVTGSWELNPGSAVVVSLEDDATWITPPSGTVPEGLTVEVLALPPAGAPEARPSLAVGGLGIRLSRADGPLLDAGVTLASAAVHLFGAIAPTGSSASVAGGVRLELGGLGVPLAGAGGGDNAVAKGLMAEPGTGDDAPSPRFSPSLAVQKHSGAPLLVALTAGEGSGPWWLTVQREFGPVYLEQVGLAVVNRPSGIESIGVLIDGKVSLLGLSAAVDDLSLTYVVAGGGSALDPSRWRVDLAGFAVTADLGGVSLAGGLRKFTPGEGGVEYLGMLMARVGVYGLTVYGGFGVVGPEHDRYTSIFLFGAVNGPIGGPPAFFVTGIGGGFGINRRLSVPPDLSRFGEYPLIKALDPAARAGDPFLELEQARGFFAAERGSFWFAAGLSFTSFALVDGVAVLAVRIGGGFEVSLLGLARVALPRPEAALVSIEMALVARFSTNEGGILVQAQLTDNSWLLAPAVRLTGGFAFASWFSGPNRGQFVVTMGGYHPDFHRDGYPVVPRLGLRWQLGSAIAVVGESYFALTSEAVMAGTRVEVSARLGPAWAHAVFGADGIIYFDPFWLKVTVYASIDAGVTIDLWLGEITISVHLSARVEVTGPPYRAVARFEVGPVGLTLAIGAENSQPGYLVWEDFVPKYLEQGAERSDGEVAARVLAAVPGAGAIPPSGSSTSGGAKSPDGTTERPFRVVAEFELTVTSTAPLTALVAGGPSRPLASSHVVSVAPMGLTSRADVELRLAMLGPSSAAVDRIDRLEATPQRLGAFPIGTWGLAPDATSPSVPAGDVISATDRVVLRAFAEIPGTGPGEEPPPAIPYRQVETGTRRLNPFVNEDANRRGTVRRAVQRLAASVPEARTPTARIDAAATLLTERGGRSPADVAAWRAERASAPLLGSLGEGLGRATRSVTPKGVAPPAPPKPPPPRPPVVRALLAAPDAAAFVAAPDAHAEQVPTGTTVSPGLVAETRAVRLAPPSLAAVDAGLLAAVPARLLQVPPAAAATGDGTVVAVLAPPLTATPVAGAALVAGRTAGSVEAARLARLTAVAAGEVAVLELPDAPRDTDTAHRPSLAVTAGRARVVALGAAGGVLGDAVLDAGSRREQVARLVVPAATRGLVVLGLPPDVALRREEEPAARTDVDGWAAGVPLPSATDGVLLAAGAVLDARGRVPDRGVAPLRSGWVLPEELVSGETVVTTTFAAPPAAVAVVLEGGSAGDVSLGVDGARRPTRADGAPEPPLVVLDGPRAVLVFGLEESSPGTAVTVASGARRRLAGVLGLAAAGVTAGDAARRLADAVARRGVADVVPPPTRPGPGAAELTWKEG